MNRHQSVPQVRGMFEGDQSRKAYARQYGFRLPSRDGITGHLNFGVRYERDPVRRSTFRATPGPYAVTMSGGEVSNQMTYGPTGLLHLPK